MQKELSELIGMLAAAVNPRARKEREEREIREAAETPNFDEPNPSDWRLMVGDEVRRRWNLMAIEDRMAIIRDSQSLIMKINVFGMLRHAVENNVEIVGDGDKIGVAVGPRGMPLPPEVQAELQRRMGGGNPFGFGDDSHDGIKVRPSVGIVDGYNIGKRDKVEL